MMTTFHQQVVRIIKKVPKGKVASYGQIAALAGNPRAARQVVRTLNSSSEKENLPWHRIINSRGTISLPHGNGYELQKALLKAEGVKFSKADVIDLSRFGWSPRK